MGRNFVLYSRATLSIRFAWNVTSLQSMSLSKWILLSEFPEGVFHCFLKYFILSQKVLFTVFWKIWIWFNAKGMLYGFASWFLARLSALIFRTLSWSAPFRQLSMQVPALSTVIRMPLAFVRHRTVRAIHIWEILWKLLAVEKSCLAICSKKNQAPLVDFSYNTFDLITVHVIATPRINHVFEICRKLENFVFADPGTYFVERESFKYRQRSGDTVKWVMIGVYDRTAQCVRKILRLQARSERFTHFHFRPLQARSERFTHFHCRPLRYIFLGSDFAQKKRVKTWHMLVRFGNIPFM